MECVVKNAFCLKQCLVSNICRNIINLSYFPCLLKMFYKSHSSINSVLALTFKFIQIFLFSSLLKNYKTLHSNNIAAKICLKIAEM